LADDTNVPPEDQPKRKKYDPEVLLEYEAWWRDRQPWLQDNGYILRPRYRPDWIPSWRGNKKSWTTSEDGLVSSVGQILDAIRVADGKLVSLKKVSKSLHSTEATIGKFFSSEPLSSDPDNHCVPIYDVLQVRDDDDYIVLVMPFLRKYDSPNFETIGEVVDFFSQALKGMRFMHRYRVAHRDANRLNLMLDATPMYPDSFHPHVAYQDRRPDFRGRAKCYSRTQRPPKYYWIDFGISSQYDSLSPPPREYRIWGGDYSVPEFQDNEGLHDPFPTDVYYVGNLIKTNFVQPMHGFKFMESLVADMTQDDPTKRPTMDVVVSRFDHIRRSLSNWKLRSRVFKRKESGIVGLYRGSVHALQLVAYVLKGTPPVPVH